MSSWQCSTPRIHVIILIAPHATRDPVMLDWGHACSGRGPKGPCLSRNLLVEGTYTALTSWRALTRPYKYSSLGPEGPIAEAICCAMASLGAGPAQICNLADTSPAASPAGLSLSLLAVRVV